jgi:hypothetical protein
LSKLDPSQALLSVSKALNGFADGPEKGRLVLELLGKSTRETASFMKDLAEAGTISATVFTKQSGEAEKFNKQLFNLQKNSTDAARSLLNELLPSVNNVFEAYKKFGGVGGIAGAILGQDDASQAQATVKGVEAAITRTRDSIERMSTEAARDPGNDFLKVRIEKAQERLKGFQRELLLANEALKDAANRLSPLPVAEGDKPPVPKRGGGGGGSARLTDAQQYLESLKRQLQGTQDLSVAETVLADIQAGRLKLAKGENADALLDIAKQIDAAKHQQDQLKAEAEQVRELRAEQEKLRTSGVAVYEATRTPAEKFGLELANLQDLLQKGAIDTETYYRAVAKLREEFDKLDSAKDTISELDDFTQRAAQNVQDALGEELANVLDGNFKNIGASFTKMLNRMLAEAASAEIMKALFGDLGKGGASAGGSGGASGDSGLLGGLVKSGGDFLKSFGSSFMGAFSGGAATGTNLLERDMITLVHKGEAIVPKAYNPAAGGAGGRSVVINLSQSFAAGTTRATSLQAAADARRQLEAAGRIL